MLFLKCFFCFVIKGLVHPKILSVFTHPHVGPNLFVFICSAEHKGRYLEECFNKTDLRIPIDYHSMYFWGILRSV